MNRLIDLDEFKRQADAGELRPNQISTLIEESRQLRGLIKRAIKYAREDRMVTPKTTRLQRVLDECEKLTTEEDPPYVCPGCYAFGGEQCAPGCIDAEIEAELFHAIESGDYDSSQDDDEATP